MRVVLRVFKIVIKFSVILSLTTSSTMFLGVPLAFAQEQKKEDEAPTLTGPRKQLATIIFAGLAGAIMGLSTLSFYGRPQDHLENIALGFAVGVIGGTSWATFKAATDPSEFYGESLGYIHTRGFADSAQMASAWEVRPLKMQWSF